MRGAALGVVWLTLGLGATGCTEVEIRERGVFATNWSFSSDLPLALTLQPETTETVRFDLDIEFENEPWNPVLHTFVALSRHVEDDAYDRIRVAFDAHAGGETLLSEAVVLEDVDPRAVEDQQVEMSAQVSAPLDTSCGPGRCTWRIELDLTHAEGDAPVAVLLRPSLSLYSERDPTWQEVVLVQQ